MSPSTRARTLACLLLASLSLLAAEQPHARACAGVGRRGPVFVRGEEALIVWDPESHTEHFIRRAFFDGITEDFGFLVPTPSRPELAEVGSSVFSDLFELYRGPLRRSSGGGGGGRSRSRAAAVDSVVVLEERTVAGMDAAVLLASDAGALDGWLRQHGYPSGPELQSYTAPYVAAGWIVTAFRISPGSAATGRFSTSSVRMSFVTARPFFPYSEPQHGAAASARPYRVSIVAPQRMRSFLDRPGGGARVAWQPPAYAGQPPSLSRILAPVLPARATAGAWLTTFDEPRSQRGVLDLFFEPDPSQRPRGSTITTAIRP